MHPDSPPPECDDTCGRITRRQAQPGEGTYSGLISSLIFNVPRPSFAWSRVAAGEFGVQCPQHLRKIERLLEYVERVKVLGYAMASGVSFAMLISAWPAAGEVPTPAGRQLPDMVEP